MDIIKSGGYKIRFVGSSRKNCTHTSILHHQTCEHDISALDVERVLLEHPAVGEVAVIGVEDDTWGEKVAAVVGLAEGFDSVTLADLRNFAEARMRQYKCPTLLTVLPGGIPRNAMGKVNKKNLKKEVTFAE